MPSFDLFSFKFIDLHSSFPVILPNHAVQGFRTSRFLHLWGGGEHWQLTKKTTVWSRTCPALRKLPLPLSWCSQGGCRAADSPRPRSAHDLVSRGGRRNWFKMFQYTDNLQLSYTDPWRLRPGWCRCKPSDWWKTYNPEKQGEHLQSSTVWHEHPLTCKPNLQPLGGANASILSSTPACKHDTPSGPEPIW